MDHNDSKPKEQPASGSSSPGEGLDLPVNRLIDPLAPGEMAALSARAGVGKSAVLVQIALAHLLRDEEVLHVSLGHPVRHVRRSYDDIIDALHERIFTKASPSTSLESLRVQTERNRHIHSYLGHEVSPKKIEKALSFLRQYAHFNPVATIVDGLDFRKVEISTLEALKQLAKSHGFILWFSALSHRTDSEPLEGTLPAPLKESEPLWDAVYKLSPKKDAVPLVALKVPTRAQKFPQNLYVTPGSMVLFQR